MSSPPILPHIGYDSVVFGYAHERLKILLLKYRNTEYYALPGGFVQVDENLNDAVRRGLKERTGLDNIYQEQFYTFGNVERHQPQVTKSILESVGNSLEEYKWLLERFISVGYYALIDFEKVQPKADELSESCTWYDVDKLPRLMLDHEEIVQKALASLRLSLDRNLIGFELLPPIFTMKELQKVYEVVLGERMHRGTFQRKMLSLGILKRHEKRFSGAANKAPFEYSFIRNE